MNKLAYYLRRTAAKEVNVKFEQVVELIGEEKAKDLSIFVVKKQEIRTSHIGRRSAVPAAKRINNDGLAGFNRRQLLEAILEVQGSDYQLKDSKGNDPEPLANEAPNPNLLPDTKQREELKAKLQAKGFTVD